MNKVVIKILQGSVVTQTVLGGLTIISPSCKFPTVCQKLWKLVGSRQSYFSNKYSTAYFILGHPVCMYASLRLKI